MTLFYLGCIEEKVGLLSSLGGHRRVVIVVVRRRCRRHRRRVKTLRLPITF